MYANQPRTAGPALATLALPFLIFPMVVAAESAGRSGKEVVAAVCTNCHGEGLQGAPKIGDRAAWKPRASQGLTGLTAHAISGVRGMPAHGGQPDLSDLEIGRAITEMVNRSGGHWIEPVSKHKPAPQRGGEAVVKAQCIKCHETGVAGAPRIGDRDAWIPRMKNGLDNLVASAIRGHGGMPPRGGQADLTDAETRSAVLYMFNPDGARVQQASGAPPAPRRGPDEVVVDGIAIHLGLMPAERMRGYPARSEEGSMHGGVPSGDGYYHVNVSVFDATTGVPVGVARIEARVEQPGTSGETRSLDPMTIKGERSYGSYFRLAAHTPYAFTVRVQREGRAETSEASFRSQSE